MTHTSSKKHEDLEDGIDVDVLMRTKIRNILYNNEVGFSMTKAGSRTADEMAEELICELSEAALNLVDRSVTQALKELREEAKVYEVQEIVGTSRISAVPIEAIDNKIKELEGE